MINNVVCTASVGCRIDLRTLTKKTVNIIYDPSRYSGVQWKHPKIGGHCNVFSTGKIMVNGKATSIFEAKQRLRRYARLIQRLGWIVTLSTIEVVTISASFKVEGPVDLHKVVRYYHGHYEPELFPAAMFTQGTIHFTCFHSGSVLMTGIKDTQQLYDICLPELIELPLL